MPSHDSINTRLSLSDYARIAVTRFCDNQQPAGYWFTAYTASTQFDHPCLEVNVFLPALLADVITVGVDPRLNAARQRAIAFLASQIESDGLVRYFGKPGQSNDIPSQPLISPDSDDTALVWRLAGGQQEWLPRVLSTLAAYRTDEGLYRTWLAPLDAFVGIDRGSDPNPPDVAIQMHLLMFLATADLPVARELYTAFRKVTGEKRLWVYYAQAPLVPILRQADLNTSGFPLVLPSALVETSIPGQQQWVAACRWISHFKTGEGSVPAFRDVCALLELLARDDFARVQASPPLMYHNDLTATTPRFYWSEDLGYALWLRLYSDIVAASPPHP